MNKIAFFILLSLIVLQSCADRKSPASEENQSMNAPANKENVAFKATGNEPFWALEIDFNQQLHFNTMDKEFVISGPVGEPVRPQDDAKAVRYAVETKDGDVQVTIFREKCTDSMSGFHFDYRVRVQAQKEGMSEPVAYEGCGAYQGDYRLNDIWALESIGSEPVEKSGQAPNLEFQLMEGRFFGFAGCNRLNGSIEMTENTIRFSRVAATKKLCPDMSIENRFMEMIDGKELKFSLEEGQLTLSGEEGKFVFRKVD